MSIFKCKICGGTLEITANQLTAECEYCGTVQTLPKNTSENITTLFNRANNLRLKSEFDKAAQIYEKIIELDAEESEAYWGLVLCKYGIEYVEDPKTMERIPTCHRTLFESVTSDADYLAAIDFSDISQQSIYEAEARKIDRIQKDILAIVADEKPFDVFICYKETDENGKRTVDSTIANDIYYQLTQEGFKVFYAAITLEDKLGKEYEPYIFAALNSAKVMLAIGTKPEYFTSVWVKNEWSRFLKLIKTDRTKLLIPCYRDMDAYDLPDEFAHLQAQDMSKIGFINDVVRGIKKVIAKDEPKQVQEAIKETVIVNNTNTNTAALLRRMFMFLEDRDWASADEYAEKVLDMEPECAEAYLGKLMADLKCPKQDELRNQAKPFDSDLQYAKVIRYAGTRLRTSLAECIKFINERNENERKQKIYDDALHTLYYATTEIECNRALGMFKQIWGFKDSDEKAQRCTEKAETIRKDNILSSAKGTATDSISSIESAMQLCKQISGWRDADNYLEELAKKLVLVKDSVLEGIHNTPKDDIKKLEEAIKRCDLIPGWKDADECKTKYARLVTEINEEMRKAEEKSAKRKQTAKIMVGVFMGVAIVFAILWSTVISPMLKYNEATALIVAEKYDEAIVLFTELGEYKDSKTQIKNIQNEKTYINAVAAYNAGNFDEARELFDSIRGYKDSNERWVELQNEKTYLSACELLRGEKYFDAINLFILLRDYKDSKTKLENTRQTVYDIACQYMKTGEYSTAGTYFTLLANYKDSAQKVIDCNNASSGK